MRKVMTAVRLLVWLTLLTGIIYPLLITVIVQWIWIEQASGSLVMEGDKVIGSRLIAQKFSANKYFWPRPSASDFNTLPAKGSNLSATSARLKRTVDSRIAALKKGNEEVPAELVFASGSGLDPHISLKTAYFQAARIAQARNLRLSTVEGLISERAIKAKWKFQGNDYVNVLDLNLALDKKTNP